MRYWSKKKHIAAAKRINWIIHARLYRSRRFLYYTPSTFGEEKRRQNLLLVKSKVYVWQVSPQNDLMPTKTGTVDYYLSNYWNEYQSKVLFHLIIIVVNYCHQEVEVYLKYIRAHYPFWMVIIRLFYKKKMAKPDISAVDTTNKQKCFWKLQQSYGFITLPPLFLLSHYELLHHFIFAAGFYSAFN
jgi:hypothetical protein